MSVKFRRNDYKVLEAIFYVAKRASGNDFHHILKVLYYADKAHLQKYGRPVLGDTYIRMKAGPVGSLAYDILKGSEFTGAIPPEALTAIERFDDYFIRTLRDADTNYFSRSDLECLDEAIAFCKGKSFEDLCRLTHDEKAWFRALENGEMDFENFIDDSIEHKDELIAYIKETSPFISL